MRVLFLPEVEEYLLELIDILYQKEYFNFKDTAVKYVTELVQDISNSLPYKQRQEAPIYFSKYGAKIFYACFKKSKNTQWYVFFSIYEEENICLVRYIATNHTCSQYL